MLGSLGHLADQLDALERSRTAVVSNLVSNFGPLTEPVGQARRLSNGLLGLCGTYSLVETTWSVLVYVFQKAGAHKDFWVAYVSQIRKFQVFFQRLNKASCKALRSRARNQS